MNYNGTGDVGLAQAKFMLWAGEEFGTVHAMTAEADRAALREWYVREPLMPALAARTPSPTQQLVDVRGVTTGDVCRVCQGSRLVRTGSCLTCQDCGANEGCG